MKDWEAAFNTIFSKRFGNVSDSKESIDVFFEPIALQKELKQFIQILLSIARQEAIDEVEREIINMPTNFYGGQLFQAEQRSKLAEMRKK